MEPAAPSTFKRYVLPLTLLILVVGVLAFALQFLPSWWSRAPRDKPREKFEPLCHFLFAAPVWDPEDEGYAREIEKGEAGYVDFPFENPGAEGGKLGVVNVTCACSSILVGFPDEKAWNRLMEDRKAKKTDNLPEGAVTAWTRVVRDESATAEVSGPHPVKTSADIPPQSKGVVRIGWDGRGTPGSPIRLEVALWHKITGDDKGYVTPFKIPLVMRPTLQFYPLRAALDPIGPKDSASTEFFAWSATRSKVDVRIKGTDPLFVVEPRALSAKEIAKLQEKLKGDDIHTRIKTAWAVKATVHEEARLGDKLVQHDLGHFLHPLNVVLDGEPLDNTPVVAGRIRSNIEIGGIKDDGKVNLGPFAAERGTEVKVVLWSLPEVKLEYVGAEPRERVQAKLVHVEADAAKRNKWRLEVRIPPGVSSFPDKAAVFLRIQGIGRQIRIPVVGTAGR